MNRQEAIALLKQVLDACAGLEGHPLELAPPNTPQTGGFQIIIAKPLDDETRKKVIQIITDHGLSYQAGAMWKTKHSVNLTGSDTFIIFKPKNAENSHT